MKKISIVKLMQVKEGTLVYENPTVSCKEDAAKIAKEFLRGADREHFCVICLNTRNSINSINTISIGSLGKCIVAPRESFKTAILSNSSAVLFFHNHPSGDPRPSFDDIKLTKVLLDAGKILDIRVHDHIVIGDDEGKFVSMRETSPEIF